MEVREAVGLVVKGITKISGEFPPTKHPPKDRPHDPNYVRVFIGVANSAVVVKSLAYAGKLGPAAQSCSFKLDFLAREAGYAGRTEVAVYAHPNDYKTFREMMGMGENRRH